MFSQVFAKRSFASVFIVVIRFGLNCFGLSFSVVVLLDLSREKYARQCSRVKINYFLHRTGGLFRILF